MSFPEDYYAMTLQEIANELGCSREAVRQVEQRALHKLRTSRFRALLSFSVAVRQMRDQKGCQTFGFPQTVTARRPACE